MSDAIDNKLRAALRLGEAAGEDAAAVIVRLSKLVSGEVSPTTPEQGAT
jgi:hypothetical protein